MSSLIPPRMLCTFARRLLLAVAVVAALAGLLGRGAGSPGELLPVARSGSTGYWLVGSQGGVFAFGGAPDLGGATNSSAPVAAIATTSSGRGYWLATSRGVVTAYGDAVALGGLGHVPLVKPIVGMAPTRTGGGYWLVASDGGVFAFGDAKFFGSMGGRPLNKPIVGMTPSPSGQGYWFVASDGGLFAFGDAGFFGSMGATVLNKPVVGMAASRTGRGYRLVAADGGVFSFGDARFYGSTGNLVLNKPITSMAATPSGEGYWFVATDGGVFSFGDAIFAGSAVGRGQSIAGMAVANALPRAANDAVSLDEDSPVSVDVLANDRNLHDGPITVTLLSGPDSGTASVDAGRISYRPRADFSGSDQLTYRVADGDGDTAVATLALTVRPVNDVPEVSSFGPAGADSAAIDEDTQGSIGFAVFDKETAAGNLSLATRSSNPTLLPDANITVTGTGGSRTVHFTPAANQTGTAVITVTVSDGQASSSKIFTVNVGPVNDFPTLGSFPSNKTIDEDTDTGELDFSVNDSETADSALAVTATSDNGSLVGSSGLVITKGSGGHRILTVTPKSNASGTARITVTVSDGELTASRSFILVVKAVNDLPVVSGEDLVATEDQGSSVSGQVTAKDVESTTLSYAAGAAAGKGDVTVNATTGAVTYKPRADEFGADSFTVIVTDGNSGSSTATFNVAITPVSDVPVATDTALTTAEDTPASVTIAASDADGDALTFTLDSEPAHGSVVVNGLTGQATYTPDPNSHGTDSFTVLVKDEHDETDTATVAVTVSAVNDTPQAGGDVAETVEDVAATIPVLANDVGTGDGPVTITITNSPADGDLLVNADNTLTYTPTPNWSGVAVFDYSVKDVDGESSAAHVTVNVAAVNDAPVANTAVVVTTEDTPATGSLSASDVEDSTLTYSLATGPAHGDALVSSNGSFTYMPDADWHGSDSFTFKASDGDLDSAPASVTVTVSAENDTPVAAADVKTTDEDTSVVVAVLGNDIGLGDGVVSVEITSEPDATSGATTVNADKTVTFTPAANWSGTASFIYEVADADGQQSSATVTMTVIAVNDAPTLASIPNVATNEDTPSSSIALTVGDVDAAAVLTLSGGADPALVEPSGFAFSGTGANRTLVITPKANAVGTAQLTVTVSDGSATASRTFTLTVNAVNDAPTAEPQSFNATEDTAFEGTLTGTDIDSTELTFTLATPAAHGSVAVDADGTFDYLPSPNFAGTDSFTFTVSDGPATSGPVTATINVANVNDAPVAVDDTVELNLFGSANFNLLTNDSDADAGDSLTITFVTRPAQGVFTCTNGQCSITGGASSDSFTYRLTDAAGLTSTATVTFG